MLDVRRLRMLLAVQEYGSIAAAAKVLSFTPPALSQQLAALERQLDVALLDRGQRRVRLTQAGHRLASYAEQVLAQLEAAVAEMAVMGERVAGTLCVGALPTIGASLLPVALTALRDTAPGLELRVEQMEAEESLPALKRGELDAALVGEYGSVPQRLDPSLDRHDLLVERVLVAVPDEHPLQRSPVRFAEMREELWVAPGVGACLLLLERACGLAGFDPRIVGHCGDFTMALALVSAGLGVALVPSMAAYRAGAACGVRLLTLTEPTVHRTLHLAVRRGGSHRPAVQRLRDALGDAAGDVAGSLPGSITVARTAVDQRALDRESSMAR